MFQLSSSLLLAAAHRVPVTSCCVVVQLRRIASRGNSQCRLLCEIPRRWAELSDRQIIFLLQSKCLERSQDLTGLYKKLLWKIMKISLHSFLSSFNLSDSVCAANDHTENLAALVFLLNLFDAFLKFDRILACSSNVNFVFFYSSTLSVFWVYLLTSHNKCLVFKQSFLSA